MLCLQANHTFVFVDKLRTLSKTLLSIASSSQSSGHGQMLGQLQVSVLLAEGLGSVCRGGVQEKGLQSPRRGFPSCLMILTHNWTRARTFCKDQAFCPPCKVSMLIKA